MTANRFEPSPDARFTLFHVFWVVGALGCSFLTWHMTPRVGTLWRALLTLAAGVAGFFVACLLITFVVIYLVIPHLPAGSRWSGEVNAYMAFLLGMEWTNAGRPRQHGGNE